MNECGQLREAWKSWLPMRIKIVYWISLIVDQWIKIVRRNSLKDHLSVSFWITFNGFISFDSCWSSCSWNKNYFLPQNILFHLHPQQLLASLVSSTCIPFLSHIHTSYYYLFPMLQPFSMLMANSSFSSLIKRCYRYIFLTNIWDIPLAL